MAISLLFWILYIVALVFYGFGAYKERDNFSVGNILWWVLIGLLGYGVFGAPIK